MDCSALPRQIERVRSSTLSRRAFVYGRTGVGTPNHMNNLPRFRSHNLKVEFNVDKANRPPDNAGYRNSEVELDPVKRAALCIRMNDPVCGDCAVISIVHRPAVSGMKNGLKAPLSGWTNELATIAHGYRES